MATYILLTTLTSEGAQTLHAHPERLSAVNEEIAKLGCSVQAQYATLGAYDFVTVLEAPDNATVAHLSVDLASRGTAKITTLPAVTMTALMDKLKGPDQIGKS